MVKTYLMRIYILILLVLTAHVLFAQDDNKQTAREFVEIADEIYYVQKAPEIAKENYMQAAELDPENVKANFMAGLLHLETVNKDRATKYLLKVLDLDPAYKFNLLYLIGNGYHYGYEFDKAIDFYQKYLEKSKLSPDYRGVDKVNHQDVERRIVECENGKIYKANPGKYSIVNIGKEINSESFDYAPVLNVDETRLIFTTRRRDGNLNENVDRDNFPFEDIFIVEKKNGKWSQATNIGEIVNTPNHDSNLSLSADGKVLYLYKDDNNGDFFVSELKNNNWTPPTPLVDINSSFAETSISMSADGQKLYFSSNRPGGYGGFDIYLATKDSRGKWSQVSNLGPTINTTFDEEGPFIDYDNKTLYFSSRGHKGMGGYDIYKSEFDSEKEEWSEPLNLGYPINTPDDDIYFVGTKDGKRGYYSSVREDGMGYTDIYEITIPELINKDANIASKTNIIEENNNNHLIDKPINAVEVSLNQEPGVHPVTLMVKIEDYENARPLEARVVLKSVKDNVEVASINMGEAIYKFELTPAQEKEYMLSAEKEGYMFKNFKIALPAAGPSPQEIRRKIEMNRLQVGFKTVLRNIYFDFNKASFTIDSYNELNKIESMMSENASIIVEIAGHTDRIGTPAYNLSLSQKRANAVVDYLTNKGIDPRRLVAEGYGETKPLASNDDEQEGRELNRRVEFKVIDQK